MFYSAHSAHYPAPLFTVGGFQKYCVMVTDLECTFVQLPVFALFYILQPSSQEKEEENGKKATQSYNNTIYEPIRPLFEMLLVQL